MLDNPAFSLNTSSKSALLRHNSSDNTQAFAVCHFNTIFSSEETVS